MIERHRLVCELAARASCQELPRLQSDRLAPHPTLSPSFDGERGRNTRRVLFMGDRPLEWLVTFDSGAVWESPATVAPIRPTCMRCEGTRDSWIVRSACRWGTFPRFAGEGKKSEHQSGILPPLAGKHRQDCRCLQRSCPKGEPHGCGEYKVAAAGRGRAEPKHEPTTPSNVTVTSEELGEQRLVSLTSHVSRLTSHVSRLTSHGPGAQSPPSPSRGSHHRKASLRSIRSLPDPGNAR